MKQQRWPEVLMIVGFIPAILLIAAQVTIDLSDVAATVASIGSSLGIGVGSIGLGARLSYVKASSKPQK